MTQRTASTSFDLMNSSSKAGSSNSQSAISKSGSPAYRSLIELARIAETHQTFQELADNLIYLTERAYNFRDMKTVAEVSGALMNLPLSAVRQAAQYYQALVAKRTRHVDEAQYMLESLADNAPPQYRSRALQTLGVIHHERGNLDDALRLYVEASRAAQIDKHAGFLASLLAYLQISVIKSHMGDHLGALDHLESLSPLVELAAKRYPLYYYFYHNSLAVEFSELGRIGEAQVACAVALDSPFAAAYPEWIETRDEIAAKRACASRSVVAINRASEAAPSLQAKLLRETKPVRPNAFRWLTCNKTRFQRPSAFIGPIAAIFRSELIHSILDRVLTCIEPRAPPSLPESISNQ